MTESGYEQYANYSEMTGVPEGKGFREQLGGQELEFTRDPDSAEGKLLFSLVNQDVDPVELVNQAVEAKAAGLILLNGYAVTLTEFPSLHCQHGSFRPSRLNTTVPVHLKVEPWWNPARSPVRCLTFPPGAPRVA
ncbi:MAG: hypothetical protein ACLU9S_14625 [Oscillospiraceae bacterium]